jgi:ribonucleoside-diphosphate reductase alpha chain
MCGRGVATAAAPMPPEALAVAGSASADAISKAIWETRYQFRDREGDGDRTIADTWDRVSTAIAAAEPSDGPRWARRFRRMLGDLTFLPGGRILAGAGTARRVTLFNCFVMGTIDDSMEGIFRALEEGARTMHHGGGVGYDFSTLRPGGAPARSTGQIASGPVSFLRVWDAMCGTIQATSARRGAMMGTLRCDHPDIEAFVDAKRGGGLPNFNLSVQITDRFLEAARLDREVPLHFPSGNGDPQVYGQRKARDLLRRILESALACGEPGLLFIDRINRANNLWYRERITATNPCGEVPLPPYGACNLGSLNLPAFVRRPFEPEAHLDLTSLAETAALATRFLEDVIDVSRFPLPAQAEEARATRRIGLGVTGLGDALVLLGHRYDRPEARTTAARALQTITHAAYRASVALASERGPFPAFQRQRYLEGEFIERLPAEIRSGIRESGIRNSHLIALAPAGTISLLAGNVSSGIEPIFRARYQRRIHRPGGTAALIELTNPTVAGWQARPGAADSALPPAFLDARDVSPEAHVDMQAALQPHVDGSISKTVQLPLDYTLEALDRLIHHAHAAGLKGLTVFPARSPIGEVLVAPVDRLPLCDTPACAPALTGLADVGPASAASRIPER